MGLRASDKIEGVQKDKWRRGIFVVGHRLLNGKLCLR